ncbi:MAG TPA: hypothetical protein VN962_26630 [Polyangia bacterium]|nr:hypothetical protein [Polyangia bacterium]
MSDWFRADLRIAFLIVAAALGCAETLPSAPAASAGVRASADDSDLWNLAPVAADTVAEIDLSAMRTSPWTRSLMESGLSGQREQSRRAYGYDPFTDADRLLAVAVETGSAPRELTVLRGRFDATQVGAAFASAKGQVAATRWRDSPVWEAGGRAVALVTPRTLVTGGPADVRAAIDAAWGVVPDAKTGPLGELRRAMAADRDNPAAFVAVTVTEALRARAAGFLALPAGLQRFAARIDLGQDLNMELTGAADTAANAAAAANALVTAARSYAQGTMVRLLGLSPVLNSLSVGAEGTRLHGHVQIPVEQRERLADKVLAVLQMLAATRH